MDRRYYGLKALVVVVGIIAAVVSGVRGTSDMARATAHLHYGAAASVQASVLDASMRVSHAFVGFFRAHACLL